MSFRLEFKNKIYLTSFLHWTPNDSLPSSADRGPEEVRDYPPGLCLLYFYFRDGVPNLLGAIE